MGANVIILLPLLSWILSFVATESDLTPLAKGIKLTREPLIGDNVTPTNHVTTSHSTYASQEFTYVPVSEVPWENIRDDAECGIVQYHGYIKIQCTVVDVKTNITKTFFKCPNSDNYYSAVKRGCKNQQFSAACPNDPKFYQMCGAVKLCEKTGRGGFQTIEDMHYHDKFLCTRAVCDNGNYTLGVTDICHYQGTCRNVADIASTCPAHDETDTYTCSAYWTPPTIPSYQVCDGLCDCPVFCDDEGQCNGRTYGMFCEIEGKKLHLPAEWMCDGTKDCDGKEDERGCDGDPKCRAEHLHKGNGRQITNRTRCAPLLDNLYSYCDDFSDQLNCTDPSITNLTCFRGGYPVSVANRMICHGIPGVRLCDDGFENMCVQVNMACLVHKHQLCDEEENCLSGADELPDTCRRMSNTICERVFGMKNRVMRVPLSWINDGYKDCVNGEDEEVIQPTCGLSLATIRLKNEHEHCEEVFLCGFPPTAHIELENLCHKADACGNENAVCRVALEAPRIQQKVKKHDGILTLSYCFEGLKSIEYITGQCSKREFANSNGKVLGRTEVLLNVPETISNCNYAYGEMYIYLACLGRCVAAPCPIKKALKHDSCSGQYPSRVYTLVNNDFLSFLLPYGDNQYHNNLFPCENGRCIPYEKVCNLANDCGDFSDEINCTNHFTCSESSDYIPISSVCDGKPDCHDFSDECNDRCTVRIIENVVLEGLAWIFGSLAALFNLIIILRGVYFHRKASSVAMLLNKTLILLIASGDLSTGVYLLTVSVYHSRNYDSYCPNRFKWLTSTPCAVIGIMNTVGSQLSLFSMTVLSLTRVIRMNNISISGERTFKSSFLIFLVGFAILAVSGVIAIIPLFGFFEDFFVNGIHYPGNPLFVGSVKKSKHIEIFDEYFGRIHGRALTWRTIDRLVVGMFSREYKGIVKNKIHFYGNAGVCLFKFFVTPDDPQRIYVWVILVLNVICFAAITVAYIIIHFISTKSSEQFAANDANEQIKRRNTRLQRKITLIIGTDFCCWIPFILMCFLHSIEVTDASPYYSLFSIVILPINSVINPLLYDNTFSLLLTKIGAVLCKPFQTTRKIRDQNTLTSAVLSSSFRSRIDASVSEDIRHSNPKSKACSVDLQNKEDAESFIRRNSALSGNLLASWSRRSMSPSLNKRKKSTGKTFGYSYEGAQTKNDTLELKRKQTNAANKLKAVRQLRRTSVVSEILNEEKPRLKDCTKWKSQEGSMIEEETFNKTIKRANTESSILGEEKKKKSTGVTINLNSITNSVTKYKKASRGLQPKGQSITAEETSKEMVTQSCTNVNSHQDNLNQQEENFGLIDSQKVKKSEMDTTKKERMHQSAEAPM